MRLIIRIIVITAQRDVMLARAGDTVTTVVLVDMLVAAGVAVEPVHLTPIQDEDGAVVEVVQLVMSGLNPL